MSGFFVSLIYMIDLNESAIKDLRVALRKSYGDNFDMALSDVEVNEIGDLLLTVFAESLKIKVAAMAQQESIQ